MGKDLTTIYNHFGQENQLKKLVEEANELLNHTDRDNYIEELADVEVVLRQLINALNDNQASKFFDIVDKKINRTLERIGSGYYKQEAIND